MNKVVSEKLTLVFLEKINWKERKGQIILQTFQKPKSGNIMTSFVKKLSFLRKPTWKDSQDFALIETRPFGLNAVYEAAANGEAGASFAYPFADLGWSPATCPPGSAFRQNRVPARKGRSCRICILYRWDWLSWSSAVCCNHRQDGNSCIRTQSSLFCSPAVRRTECIYSPWSSPLSPLPKDLRFSLRTAIFMPTCWFLEVATPTCCDFMKISCVGRHPFVMKQLDR